MNRFPGSVVVVTGGGSGIGRATAARFASEGAIVVVADIDLAAAEAVAEELRRAGGSAHATYCDQADEGSVSMLFAHEQLLGGVDVVYVNAGIAIVDVPLSELRAEDWLRVHGVNLFGAFLVARAAVAGLRCRGGGAIVFTSSTAALRALPNGAAYAASKAGLLGLSRTLATELGRDGIRVNCVCPGAVDTPLVDRAFGAEAARALELSRATSPLGRVAEPEDVAAAVCFLASSDARHITATELVVDGGASANEASGEPVGY